MVVIRAGRLRVTYGAIVSVGRVAGLVAALAGCSSVPDAINPVEWYKGARDLITGDDSPEVAGAPPAEGNFPDVNAPSQSSDEPADGLVGDTGHARYAAAVHREVTPTKQALRRSAPVQDTQTVQATAAQTAPSAAAPLQAAAPAPAVRTVATASSPNAGASNAELQRQAIARADLGPTAPPAKAPDMAPPSRPDIPDSIAGSASAGETVKLHRPRLIDQEYQRRLAESSSTVVRSPAFDGVAVSGAPAGAEAPVHLHPPRGGSGRGLAAPEPESASSSFQVAALDFAEGNAQLTAQDHAALAEVAKLARSTKGTVRVLGHSPAGYQAYGDVGSDRADAIAAELVRRGVPAGRIMVAGAPMPPGGAPGAQVFLDY